MSAFRIRIPGLAPPPSPVLWLLEGGIALILGAYAAHACHQPLLHALNAVLGARGAGAAALLLMAGVAFPLLSLLLLLPVLLLAGMFAHAVRSMVDVLVMAGLITALVVPTVQNLMQHRAAPSMARLAAPPAPQTGPLNAAPPPLALERIPLGAEILNTGAHAVEVKVLFVRPNERGRSYCAGKALTSDPQERTRLASGERMIFTSGNCQYGHVALTVWDASGNRIYQTSAVPPPVR